MLRRKGALRNGLKCRKGDGGGHGLLGSLLESPSVVWFLGEVVLLNILIGNQFGLYSIICCNSSVVDIKRQGDCVWALMGDCRDSDLKFGRFRGNTI